LLTCAAITHNLIRAACLASPFHARTHSATTRADMIDVPPARRCRGHLILHLPQCWHREAEWLSLFETVCRPLGWTTSDQPEPSHTRNGTRHPAQRPADPLIKQPDKPREP